MADIPTTDRPYGASLYEIARGLQIAPQVAQNYYALDAMRRQRELETRLPQDIAAATGAPKTTIVPAAPGTPPVPATPGVAPTSMGGPAVEGGPDIMSAGTPGTPEIPGTPETPAVEGQTLANLVSRLGPDVVTRLMSTPQGRQTLTSQGVITEEEVNRRQRVSKALNEYGAFMEDARRLMTEGDASGSDMKRARAWERLAQASDDPNKAAWAYQKAAELQKQALDAKKNDFANEDYRRFGEAWNNWDENPSLDTAHAFIHTAADMKWATGLRDKLFQGMTAKTLAAIDDPAVRTFLDAVTTRMNEQSGNGTPVDFVEAIKDVTRRHPELIGPSVVAYLSGKTGKVPPEFAQAVFGRQYTSDQYRLAQTFTEAEGLNLNDPDPTKAKTAAEHMHQHLKSIVSTTRNTIENHWYAVTTQNQVRSDQAELGRVQKILTDAKTIIIMKNQDPKGYQDLQDQRDDLKRRIKAGTDFLGKLGYGPAAPAEGPAAAVPASPSVPGPATTAPGAAPKFGAAAGTPNARLKANVDGLVGRSYPGRSWPQLTTQEKQRVLDQINSGQ